MKFIKDILNSSHPFFKGSPKSIRLAFIGFVIAAIGAVIGFAGQSLKPLAYIAFGITSIGVTICGIGVVLGFIGGKKWN